MGYRLTKIYTKTGDDGTTQIGPGLKISKDDIRIEVLGSIDELNSQIGLVLALQLNNKKIEKIFRTIQQDLFNLGGELCPPHKTVITRDHVESLEHMIDAWNATLAPLEEFIMPGGNLTSATCHIARTICRRAERHLVTLQKHHPFNQEILCYVNRLSDLLFVLARVLGKENSAEEILWQH